MEKQLVKSGDWNGRVDGSDPDSLRWHQVVEHLEMDSLPVNKHSWIITGFAGDEGVKRNLGRVGAKGAPTSIRRASSNLPITRYDFEIYDLGDYKAGSNLEADQQKFSNIISGIHKSGNKSVVLGGGHEIAYPHFLGMKTAYPDQRIGIISFDAHYDLRKPEAEIGVTSGTGFYQILEEYPDTGYLILGVNEASNTETLKKRASRCHVEQLSIFDLQTMPVDDILYNVRIFAQKYDLLYLTVCMDVFASSFAPGVSAPAALGIVPDARFFNLFREIQRLNKIYAFDIAEVNPELDHDERTSRLAAQMLYYWMS